MKTFESLPGVELNMKSGGSFNFIINPTRNEWDFNKHEEIPRVSGEISNRNPTSAQHEWDFDLKFHHSRVGFLSVC